MIIYRTWIVTKESKTLYRVGETFCSIKTTLVGGYFLLGIIPLYIKEIDVKYHK